MARVPDYPGRQVGIRPIGAPGFTMRGPDMSGLTQGIAQVESGFVRMMQQEREKADTAAVMDADRQLTEWQLNTMFNPENGVYTRKGGNALDVTNQTLSEYEKAQEQIGQGLKNEQQRARFAEIVARRRQSLNGDLNKYEFQERQRYYDQVDAGQIETSMQGAALNYNDPDKIAYFQNKMAVVLASQAQRKGLPEEAANAALLRANSGMSKAVIGRMVADDPYRARDYFQQAQKAMTAEDQVQVQNMIDRAIRAREVEARQLQAMARAELSSRAQDAQAAYLQGLDFASPPSERDFVAAYGGEEGRQRYQDLVKVQQLGGAIRDIATASPQERAQLVNDFNPAKFGIAQEGFARDAQLYGTLVNAATSLQRELQDDPAGYAAKYSPEIRQAIEALQGGDDGAAEAYAMATIAEQQRLGVMRPQLLTKDQAASIVARFEQTEDGGSNAAAMISQLQGQWGKHWPTVFGQLQSKLPGAALVIGTGVDEATAATLARIAPLKTSELKKGFDSADTGDTTRQLNDLMGEFRGTLMQQAGGERTFVTMYEEAERLALANMAQGKSPKDAAAAAFDALVGERYEIRGSWRAPKAYNADLIERGANLVLESIDPDTLSFDVPQGVAPEFASERVKAALNKDGYWATMPDESGLVLYYGGAAVLDREGNPIVRSWNELAGEAAASPTRWQRFQEGRRSFIEAQEAAKELQR